MKSSFISFVTYNSPETVAKQFALGAEMSKWRGKSPKFFDLSRAADTIRSLRSDFTPQNGYFTSWSLQMAAESRYDHILGA
jgi:hypothetical protein